MMAMAHENDENIINEISTPKTGALNHLSQLLLYQQVQEHWFKNKQVTLDGYHFTRCRFDGCMLYINSAEFLLTSCVIAPDCKVFFGQKVSKILRVYFREHPGNGYYAPIAEPDGTITINENHPG